MITLTEHLDVAVCIIHQELISMEWAVMLRQLDIPKETVQKGLFFNRNKPYDMARQEVTEKALELNPNYIFFLDCDTSPLPRNTITALIELSKMFDLPVVSGLYWARKKINIPCAWYFNGYQKDKLTPTFKNIAVDDEVIKQRKLIQCDVVGLGCCLIRTDVFKKYHEKYGDDPYYKWGIGLNPKELRTLGWDNTSEDFNFFLRLNNIGIHPVVATMIQCDHITWAKKRGLNGEYTLLDR